MPNPDRVVGVIGQRGVAARIPEKIAKRRTAEDYSQEEHDPQQTFPELFEWNEFHRLLDSMINEKNVSVQFRVRYKFRLVHGVADGGFEESLFYYTTPQAKKQAGNAGNAKIC